jgi:uncharacterized protein (DUF58 family)
MAADAAVPADAMRAGVLTWRAMLPSPALIWACLLTGTLCTALCFTAIAESTVARLAACIGVILLVLIGLDIVITTARWRRAPLTVRRQLPRAFALGRPLILGLTLENPGGVGWRGRLFELADPSLAMPDMPLRFDVPAERGQHLEFEITPTQRGVKRFDATQILLRSRLGLIDWNLRIGSSESRRVFPNFEDQTAFAWLTAERRLSDMGIKSVRRRGAGTDFDQLVEYRAGDPVRHIDWKATRTHHRPIVRTFQDDRDQRVMLVLDCGRRMRSDDTRYEVGAAHFDQALNAVMLLAFVALNSGDAVGAMTFGTPAEGARGFAPRKGRQSLHALMAELGDVEPTLTFSDYTRCAADLMGRQRKRALVVLITNCRDEDSEELAAALALLRSRHLVVLANLRERIVGLIAAQPLNEPQSGLEAAAALEYQQARGRMLRRFAVGGALVLDCEPERLGVDLVNRYTALKRSRAM